MCINVKAISGCWVTFSQIRSMDVVFSVRHPKWPDVGTEWIQRRRYHGWPSVELVHKIIQEGCHLVEKPHHSNPGKINEWRFSFSVAERTLINSWPPEQILFYHVIRLIKKEVSKRFSENRCKTFFSTYHFKTMMLWASEMEPDHFWNPRNMGRSVNELLYRIIGWLKNKYFWSYFIKSNNLIDHITDTSREVAVLEGIRKSRIRSNIETMCVLAGWLFILVARLSEVHCTETYTK